MMTKASKCTILIMVHSYTGPNFIGQKQLVLVAGEKHTQY